MSEQAPEDERKTEEWEQEKKKSTEDQKKEDEKTTKEWEQDKRYL